MCTSASSSASATLAFDSSLWNSACCRHDIGTRVRQHLLPPSGATPSHPHARAPPSQPRTPRARRTYHQSSICTAPVFPSHLALVLSRASVSLYTMLGQLHPLGPEDDRRSCVFWWLLCPMWWHAVTQKAAGKRCQVGSAVRWLTMPAVMLPARPRPSWWSGPPPASRTSTSPPAIHSSGASQQAGARAVYSSGHSRASWAAHRVLVVLIPLPLDHDAQLLGDVLDTLHACQPSNLQVRLSARTNWICTRRNANAGSGRR